jgi:hypothetical protein
VSTATVAKAVSQLLYYCCTFGQLATTAVARSVSQLLCHSRSFIQPFVCSVSDSVSQLLYYSCSFIQPVTVLQLLILLVSCYTRLTIWLAVAVPQLLIWLASRLFGRSVLVQLGSYLPIYLFTFSLLDSVGVCVRCCPTSYTF